MVKEEIENLMEKQYMKREDSNMNIFNYIP